MLITFLQYLNQTNTITFEQYNKLKDDEDPLGRLSRANILTENLVKTLSEVYQKVDKIDLNAVSLKTKVVHKIPEKIARSCCCILFSDDNYNYKVAMANPQDIEKIELISDFLDSPIQAFFCLEKDITKIINLMYRATDRIRSMATAGAKSFLNIISDQEDFLSKVDEDNYVLELLDILLTDAKNIGASDIHLEYDHATFRVRLRVDGVIEEQQLKEAFDIAAPFIRLIKLLCSMDISITNYPQDGRLDYVLKNGTTISARVSVVPNVEGESCVIRLFPLYTDLPQMNDIFPDNDNTFRIKNFLNLIQGMMLVTGPTGSGKTTTLYSILNFINSDSKKIITIEDPVELRIPRVNQIQIKEGTKLTFDMALKACLRQDPDIILLGEIRDENTANIALRAAITGHLVLSTLHTNSTISTVLRLINLKVSLNLLADAINIVIAQRLLKKLCFNCKKPLSDFENISDLVEFENQKGRIFSPVGCNLCLQTGYMGRVAIHEVLILDNVLKNLIEKGNFENFRKEAEAKLSGCKLVDLGRNLLLEGVISVDEYLTLKS